MPDQIVPSFARFVNGLAKYDFSEIGYDIIGRVFEKLIPEDERHKLGQYYTRSDIVDLINSFCIEDPEETVLDPACGAGTFLVRAYKRKQRLNPQITHSELIGSIQGVDISKFAVHLSTINLVNMELIQVEVHPQVYIKDFFESVPSSQIHEAGETKQIYDANGTLVLKPVDVVIGNPPYTRQEELEEAFSENYKEKLSKLLRSELEFKIGKRAGIYAYFFLHGYTFLNKEGKFGFITSNSWLKVKMKGGVILKTW